MPISPANPTTNTYSPQTEYRLSRDIFSFQELGGTVTSTVDSTYPFITQQIGNTVLTADVASVDTILLANFAYVVSGRWYLTHDVSATPTLTGMGGKFSVDIGPVSEVGKGHFINSINSYNVQTGVQSLLEVARYEFPVKVGTTIQIKRVTILRQWNGIAFDYSTTIDIIASKIEVLDSDLFVTHGLALSNVASGSYILCVIRKFPTVPEWNGIGMPTEKWNEHISFEFWKITGVGGTEVWAKMVPFHSIPVDDTQLKSDGSVDTTQWTLFCFSAPYDGEGIVNTGAPSLGMTVTVFNSTSQGKALYFVEKNGFCSEIKSVIPVFNAGEPDFLSELGTTSFKPTSLGQVSTRVESYWSGLYLSGTFTRTAEDGVAMEINCYLRGNGLTTNSDTVTSGVYTGMFGWAFGARNFYLSTAQSQVVLPLPVNSRYYMEFMGGDEWSPPFETSYGYANDGAFAMTTPYWLAFGTSGSVFRAPMFDTMFHNPPWYSASDILSWEFQEGTDTGTALSVTVPRSSQAKFQSGNTLQLKYWAVGGAGSTYGKDIGTFLIEEEAYSNDSGLDSPISIRCMDMASSIINNWSSPIDMFFDPKFATPQKGDRNTDAIPALKYLIEKTPSRSNTYRWDDEGLSHWGINRPAILFNHNISNGRNPLNKHRIKFDASVDPNLGIQAFGSLFSAYNDGTMAGAFIMPTPASGSMRAIFAQSDDTRSTPTLNTAATGIRIADGTTVHNRVTIMGGRLKPKVDRTESDWEIENGGRCAVGINGKQSIAANTIYRTIADDTIFGASNDSMYGYQRVAGGGTYLYEANVPLVQGTQYDFATRVMGDTVLAWYKPVQYDAGALGASTNQWTLLTYYRANPKFDTWMRPAQKKYTGVVLSTDSWFKKNEIWPDAEVGRMDIRFNRAMATYDGIAANSSETNQDPNFLASRRYLLDNRPSTVVTTADTTTSVEIPLSSGVKGLPQVLTGFGGLFKMSGLVYTQRFWDCSGSKAVSVEASVDPTNPLSSYSTAAMAGWIFQFIPNVLFRAETITAGDIVDELGIPYRAADSYSKQGYMIVGEEVLRWVYERPVRGIARMGETSTNGDHLIHIPTDHFAIAEESGKTVDQAAKIIKVGSWRNGEKGWRGGFNKSKRVNGTETYTTTATGGGVTNNIQIAATADSSVIGKRMLFIEGGNVDGQYYIAENIDYGNRTVSRHGFFAPAFTAVPSNGSIVHFQYNWARRNSVNATQTTIDFGNVSGSTNGENGLGDPYYGRIFRVGMYFQFRDDNTRYGGGVHTCTTTEDSVDLGSEILRITAVSSISTAYEGWKVTLTVERGACGTTPQAHNADVALWEVSPTGAAGSPGMGKNSHIEILTPYGIQGNSSEFHGVNFNRKNDTITEWTVSEDLNTSFSAYDVGIVSGRAQLGTSKSAHNLGDYISSYPVKNAEAAGFPADYDVNTGFGDYAIKDSVRLLRNMTYCGAYRSVRDSLFSTTALSGAKTAFREVSAEITGSYVDTLQSLYTTNNWSIALQARTSVNANANFKSAIIKFRTGSSYYLTIDSWLSGQNRQWGGDSSVRSVRMKLSYGSETGAVLEEVGVPLLGMSSSENLTLPIVVSLSGDTLSVDCMDEQLWSFDLSSYTNGIDTTYRSTTPGTVEIRTADTQTACYWFASELGDEVESTIVDRGADFGSALSFLLNGRWVKMTIARDGKLTFARHLVRRNSYDFYTAGASTVRSRYLVSTAESENPHIAAGHIESSGATFAEILDDSWIRANGYVFRESQNRLILTTGDARLESRLRIRAEKEGNQRINITGHALPVVQPEDAIGWFSAGAYDYVVDSHAISVSQAQATSTISGRKYYAI